MAIKLAFFSNDKNYARRMQKAFREFTEKRYEWMLFNDVSVLTRYLATHPVHILLTDNKEVSEECMGAQLRFYLTEDPFLAAEGVANIFKYQSIPNIHRILVHELAENADPVLNGVKEYQCRLIWVSTFTKEVDTTKYAAKLSSVLAKQSSVLYMNADFYRIPEKRDPGDFTMSDLIFSLKSRRANLALKLESVLRTSSRNFQYIYPVTRLSHLYEMTSADVRRLLDLLRQRFDYIVCASPEPVGEVHRLLLKESDRKILLWKGGEVERYRYLFASLLGEGNYFSKEDTRLSLAEESVLFDTTFTQTGEEAEKWIR